MKKKAETTAEKFKRLAPDLSPLVVKIEHTDGTTTYPKSAENQKYFLDRARNAEILAERASIDLSRMAIIAKEAKFDAEMKEALSRSNWSPNPETKPTKEQADAAWIEARRAGEDTAIARVAYEMARHAAEKALEEAKKATE